MATVRITAAAKLDIQDIFDYIAEHDSESAAEHVLGQIEACINSLRALPARGKLSEELVALGVRDYREVHFKPYRIVYGVFGNAVDIFLVADRRRNMKALLQRRLLNLS